MPQPLFMPDRQQTFMPDWEKADLAKDPCARKHGGNAESQEAFGRIEADLPRRREEVLRAVRIRGQATLKELCNDLGLTPNQISPRLKELKDAGSIRKAGYRRDGCAVLMATEAK